MTVNSVRIIDYLGEGLAAARPASPSGIPSTVCAFYFATDTGVLSIWDGSAWQTFSAGTLASTTEVLTATNTTKGATPDAIAALWEKGSDISSAGTISIGEGGFFHVTGTTTITDIDFGTDHSGRAAILVFDGALTLTYNATTLILPGAANITTAAGDTCLVVSENGTDNVRVVWYQRANGGAVSGEVLLASATPTGTGVVTFSSISQNYKHLRVRATGRSTASGANRDIVVTFNNDTGANYDVQRSQHTNTTANAAASMGATGATIGFVAGSGADANYGGYSIFEILDYAHSTLFKMGRFTAAYQSSTAAGNILVWDGYFGYRSATAISRIDLTLSSGNWDTGSFVTLHGVP